MAKFHINNKGTPGICKVKTGVCPFGNSEEHYNTHNEALIAYEVKMAEKLFPNDLNPKNKDILKILFRPGSKTLESIENFSANEKVLAFGYAGSQMYGLNTRTSDVDISVLFTGKRKDKQRIIGEYDFRVQHFNKLVERVINGNSLPEIDLVFSRTLNFTDESKNYKPLLDSLRVDTFKYYRNSESLALNFLKQIDSSGVQMRRKLKTLKVVLRTATLAYRCLEQGNSFQPVFNEKQKENFYKYNENFKNMISEKASSDDFYDYAFESGLEILKNN